MKNESLSTFLVWMESWVKLHSLQNFCRTSKHNSIAAFSWTTEGDGTCLASAAELIVWCGVFSNQLGARRFSRLGLHQTSCVEPLYDLFSMFQNKSVSFSCLGECCSSLLLWNSRNVLRMACFCICFLACGWVDKNWIYIFWVNFFYNVSLLHVLKVQCK